ncbi:cobaltochelatase subunit CobT [Phaeovibrio sulfidiphilus]|uniref:Cobaltochelatase subunit CobT n=1 Tax=Phaeovibrio sulfidiphilus TaxID=1220600 RepID=A0A8J7CWI5_9PROT|nr:cobaltochelatase subunit CobT [Phaeovibrio sulfidiphilus]MBE1237531.1 cobaltochelatase subunit CobT [Phaeovibrio sulfidiphilus]
MHPPGKARTDTERAAETLKSATTAVLKAVSGHPEVTVVYTPGQAVLSGTSARLPQPGRALSPAQVAKLRGTADAIALKLRYHDPLVNARYEPDTAPARALYTALEQARYESVGAGAYVGAGKNIGLAIEDRLQSEGFATVESAEQAEAGELVRLLALEGFGTVPLGTLGEKGAALGRQNLPPDVADALDDLFSNRDDQTGFARSTRVLLERMGLEDFDDPDEEKTDDPSSGDDSPEPEDEDTPSDPDAPDSATPEGVDSPGDMGDTCYEPGETEAPGEETSGESGEEQEAPATQGDAPSFDDSAVEAPAPVNGPDGVYRIYTTRFDEEVEAHDLCTPDELERLRAQLDQQLLPLQGVVSRLANRLQRRLMAQQVRAWEFDLEEGELDTGRLARIVANPTHGLSFRREKETDFRDTVVTLLLDNSGSMRGRPIAVTAICADILARTLERCGVKVEILGFTTSAWKGGQSRELWRTSGEPANPGRLNDLRHIIYKSADQPWRRAKKNLGLMLKEGLLKENIDGEALIWAHRRLSLRPEARRILMVISDGAPVDDSTLSANTGNLLENHLRAVIERVETASPVRLTAIGIGHDVTRYYQRAVTLNDPEELGSTIMRQVLELFSEDNPRDRRRLSDPTRLLF